MSTRTVPRTSSVSPTRNASVDEVAERLFCRAEHDDLIEALGSLGDGPAHRRAIGRDQPFALAAQCRRQPRRCHEVADALCGSGADAPAFGSGERIHKPVHDDRVDRFEAIHPEPIERGLGVGGGLQAVLVPDELLSLG